MIVPEISVYVQTYQHSAYVGDALDSVLAQELPGDLEIVVADDFSTDGTREILHAYRDRHPDLIRLVLPDRNLGPTEIFRRGAAELRGRYVAWLDGDDYWTDPRKLVRQRSALEEHPEWAGCFHDAIVRNVDGDAPDRTYVSGGIDGALDFAAMLHSNRVPSLSVMARGEHVRSLPDWVWKGLWSDWLAVLAIARHGAIGYLPEPMGVYRVHGGGVSSGLSREQQLEEDLRFFELLREEMGSEHHELIEDALGDRAAQLAVERAGVPFVGAVAVLAEPGKAPGYLNGREIRPIEPKPLQLDRRDRDGSLGIELGRMLAAAAQAKPSVAHFPGGEDVPTADERGKLHLLVVGALVGWLDRYSRLGRQLEGTSEEIWRDERCALYEVTAPPLAPAPMGALVEITEVEPEPEREGIFGCHIDSPRKGAVADAHAVEFSGWAIGEDSGAVALELASDGNAFHRVPIGIPRPDVAEAFSEQGVAVDTGFGTAVSLVGTAPQFEVEVLAVLRDQRRVRLGRIRGRRRWREDLARAGDPLVSVVIPCYGQAHYLPAAIESVLAQTYAQIEIVVVDDGSPDNVRRVAAGFPGVRCVSQANAGLAAARNAGIRESAGELLAFLDADDQLLPRALEHGVEELRDHPEAAFAFGRYRRIAADGTPLEEDIQPRPDEPPFSVFLRYNYAGVPAAGIFRRAALEEAGNFDESLPGAEDYDLALRLARQFAVRPHDEYVAEYRVHAGGMSRDPATMLEMTLRALRRQRSHVRSDSSLQSAYREGRRFWRRYYGEPLARQVRVDFANRKWGRGLRGTGSLLRLYPGGLLTLLGRTPDPGDRRA